MADGQRRNSDGEAVFKGTSLEQDKEGKDGSKCGVLKWGMQGCESELLRSALQLPNMSVSDNE